RTDFLGGGRGCGGAPIGDEVGNGDIHFMADRADHGNAAGVDGAGDGFLVEGPEVFQRAAAPADDQYVAITQPVGALDGTDDVARGFAPLHLNREEGDGNGGKAAFQDRENVMDGGTGGRRGDADMAWQGRNRTFAGFIEQAFGGQTALQCFERLAQGAFAC